MPFLKAKNMSTLWLSAALLVLLGTLLAGILGGEKSNWVWGMSQLTCPLQTGGKGGECMEGAGRGVWWMLPALWGFLLGSEQLNSKDISWLSEVSLCVLLKKKKKIPPHFTKSWISSLRLSIPGFFLFPKLHFGIVKRSSLILILVHARGCWKLLEFIVLL